jgi:hypothetical protein
MGGVFFRRDQRPKCEVINDWSEDVATFFRVVQRHYIAFMDMLRWQITSRAGFERLRARPGNPHRPRTRGPLPLPAKARSAGRSPPEPSA